MIILKTANTLETTLCTGFQPLFVVYTNYKVNTHQEQLDHIQTTFMDSNSSIGSVIESMTSQNGGQDGRHGPKMAAMTSRSCWV